LREELIADGFALDTLSMGMSHDLEAAIAEGASIVRVGTAIFGERPAFSSSHIEQDECPDSCPVHERAKPHGKSNISRA
jgi:hypothetical protein